jgi:hypothetical protein
MPLNTEFYRMFTCTWYCLVDWFARNRRVGFTLGMFVVARVLEREQKERGQHHIVAVQRKSIFSYKYELG